MKRVRNSVGQIPPPSEPYTDQKPELDRVKLSETYRGRKMCVRIKDNHELLYFTFNYHIFRGIST